IQRALDGLDLAHVHALEAVVVAGPARASQIARLLGQPARSRAAADLVADLRTEALVWEGSEGLQVPRAVADVIGDPAGLGPPSPGLASADVLERRLSRVDHSGRAILDALTWGPATGVLSEATSAGDTAVGAAARDLIEQGLLHRLDESHVLLPRQVALALRDGVLHREPAIRPPAAAGPTIDPGVVDATAGGRAAELLVLGAEIIDLWGADPPRVLRSGGVAVRDLTRLSSRLEIGAAETGWLVEVLHAARLLARDDTEDATWMPTGEADDWLDRPPHTRWAQLAQAWLTTTSASSLIGVSDSGRVNALSVQTSWPAGRQRRRDVLAALATLPNGAAPGEDELRDLVRWHHPLRMARASATGAGTGVDVVLREAEWAGVLGRGALSGPGRQLLSTGTDPAAELMSPHIPPAVDHVLLQADLTAVAPGRLDGPTRAVMRLVGDVESRGGATVHRITEQTIRRALDTGWSADRLLSEIAGISRTPIPQPLAYLVRDVARRHGVVRVGSCTAYLRCDDAALLDRVEADRALSLLQLRRIAPTVLISPVPASTALDLLREQQYGPVAEGADGGISIAPGRLHRATRRPDPTVAISSIDEQVARELVASMRHGELARVAHDEHEIPRSTDPVVTLSVLREAATDGVPVWIGYADAVGGVQRHLFRPQLVEGGRVVGTIGTSDAPRTLLLHRISGVRPAD
ncbi:MAG: helicase-associated domain-containing protein, partial [Actinobacteria bacterium]|nr:helicase-associated domain-containing protein [Actinomycetota bacterium]